MKQTGIYKITNLINSHFYIGSSIDVRRRWYKHRYLLVRGIHPNQHLQNACKKYGLSNFQLSIIEPTSDLKERENHYIKTLVPQYNIALEALGGDTISKNPNKKAIIEKIRESNLNRWAKMSPEERERLRQIRIKANTGLKRKASQYKCRPVTLDGISYPSISEAARRLSIPLTTLYCRLR